MTTDSTDRPSGGRRDDDFFAVERVGEPEEAAPSYRPAPASGGGWDTTPWPSSGPDVGGGGPAGGPVVVGGGPVVSGGGPVVSGGPVVGGAGVVVGAPSSDPFDVSSTWSGPSPLAAGPAVEAETPRAVPDGRGATPAPSHAVPLPPGLPAVARPDSGPPVTDVFGSPSGYGAAQRGYVESTPPPRYPTERSPLLPDHLVTPANPTGPVGPATGSVRIGGEPSGYPGYGAGVPQPQQPPQPQPPQRQPHPDTDRPRSGGPLRPDQTGGFPRPYQTGGFRRPATGYSGQPEGTGPGAAVDPWNGAGSGTGQQMGASLPPRQGPPTGGLPRVARPPQDGYPTNRSDPPPGSGSGPASGPGPYVLGGGTGLGGTDTGGYRIGGPGGYGVESGPAHGSSAPSPGGPLRSAGALPPGAPSPASLPPGNPPPASPYPLGGPAVTGGMPIGGESGPRAGTAGAAGSGSAMPLGAAGGHQALAPGGTGGAHSGTGPAPARTRASLPSGSWSTPSSPGLPMADQAGEPRGGEASGPWRVPGRDVPQDYLPARRRGAEPLPPGMDPLSGPLPNGVPARVDGPGSGRPDPGGPGALSGPSGPWRALPAGAPIEDTILTARPSFRPGTDVPALPPGGPGGPGTAPSGAGPVAGVGTGPQGAASPAVTTTGPGRGRRPESAVEMTSLVTRRGRGRSGADRDEDSGWQPSRSVRRTGQRGVPADRRRTPNPVTDTDSLQAVSTPAPRRGSPRPGEARDDAGLDETGSAGRTRTPRRDRSAAGALDVEDLRPENRRSAARGAGRAGRRGRDTGATDVAGLDRADGLDGPDNRGTGSRGTGSRGTGSRGSAVRGAGGRGDGGRGDGGRGSGGTGPRGGAAAERRGTRAVGVLEPADLHDEPDENSASPEADRFAWLKHGWIGPLAIALVVSLLVVGLYTVLMGGDSGEESSPEPTAPQASQVAQEPTTQEALQGRALVNGTWRCRLMVDVNSAGEPLPDVFVVEPTGLTYRWNNTPGEYRMDPSQGDNPDTTVAAVQFTSGPLAGVSGDSLVSPGRGAGGRAEGTLFLRAAQNQPDRACYVN
ncbi:hypothetical protein [Parafrankia sp. FMc2]|uniref:hypothetical protein n=1 Tax=Parafrankia sp. FMc2 TaxID=3233196 RepID=UPI0034D5724E